MTVLSAFEPSPGDGHRLASFALAKNRVDVWKIDVARTHGGVEPYRRVLSPDEVERADRFRFERHQRTFTLARAAMRQILGGYLGLPPQRLAFRYGAEGKPELGGDLGNSGIRFNLSHSGEVVLLAVTQGLTVGVDVEFVDSRFASQAVAEQFFSKSEVHLLQALPQVDRLDAFFACWTRKEAYVKALGGGLWIPLDSFDVAFGPGIKAALLESRVQPSEVLRWSMYDIETWERYRAALVVEGKEHQLRALEWEIDMPVSQGETVASASQMASSDSWAIR
jgi:4'-phosphopantetheinyl transferase